MQGADVAFAKRAIDEVLGDAPARNGFDERLEAIGCDLCPAHPRIRGLQWFEQLKGVVSHETERALTGIEVNQAR
ncbi:MAG: hypothetical protein EBT08_02850 [Betaproteobacteria bacterium]|nr:hypothetical protein [Betaproteobacteria bacterium]